MQHVLSKQFITFHAAMLISMLHRPQLLCHMASQSQPNTHRSLRDALKETLKEVWELARPAWAARVLEVHISSCCTIGDDTARVVVVVC